MTISQVYAPFLHVIVHHGMFDIDGGYDGADDYVLSLLDWHKDTKILKIHMFMVSMWVAFHRGPLSIASWIIDTNKRGGLLVGLSYSVPPPPPVVKAEDVEVPVLKKGKRPKVEEEEEHVPKKEEHEVRLPKKGKEKALLPKMEKDEARALQKWRAKEEEEMPMLKKGKGRVKEEEELGTFKFEELEEENNMVQLSLDRVLEESNPTRQKWEGEWAIWGPKKSRPRLTGP